MNDDKFFSRVFGCLLVVGILWTLAVWTTTGIMLAETGNPLWALLLLAL